MKCIIHKWTYLLPDDAHNGAWCPQDSHYICKHCGERKGTCGWNKQFIPHWELIPEHWEATEVKEI